MSICLFLKDCIQTMQVLSIIKPVKCLIIGDMTQYIRNYLKNKQSYVIKTKRLK